MLNKSMNIPYFYKIKHKSTGKYYVGSQYGKNANKNNFFKTYFTSSQKIKNIIKTEGIEIFEIMLLYERQDAREFEAYYLSKCFRLLGREKFLSLFYNRTLSPGILLDNEIIEKQNFTKKERWASGKISKPVPPNWKGKKRSSKMRERLSESKKGHVVSDETKNKLRIANLGKRQSIETKKKRLESLKNNENAFNKKHWLFISPEGTYHYSIGKRNERLQYLGLANGSGFIRYINSDKSPTYGKNKGWKFVEGEDKIKKILSNVKQTNIIYYE